MKSGLTGEGVTRGWRENALKNLEEKFLFSTLKNLEVKILIFQSVGPMLIKNQPGGPKS